MKRGLIYFLMGLLVLTFLLNHSLIYSADRPLKKIIFLTNYVFHGRHSPYFVGMDKGFYREEGFDIHIAPATGSGFVISALCSQLIYITC